MLKTTVFYHFLISVLISSSLNAYEVGDAVPEFSYQIITSITPNYHFLENASFCDEAFAQVGYYGYMPRNYKYGMIGTTPVKNDYCEFDGSYFTLINNICPSGLTYADASTGMCYDCPVGTEYDLDTRTCKVALNCLASNQVDFNGVCTDCPVNSSPETETTCKCNTGYDLIDGVCTSLPSCEWYEWRNPLTNACETHDCSGGLVPSSTYNDDASCVNPNDTDIEATDCNYPSEIFGYEFQGIKLDVFACSSEQWDVGGGFGAEYTCPDKTVACYYTINLDDINVTDTIDENVDGDVAGTGTGEIEGNITAPDGNVSTFALDLSPIEAKLELVGGVISNKLDTINNSLGADGQINRSLGDIGGLIDGGNKQNHSDLLGISSDISTASSLNHQDLEDIKDLLDDNSSNDVTLEYDDVEVGTMLTDYKTEIEGLFDTFLSDAGTELMTLYEVSIPALPDCGCVNPSYNFSIQGNSLSGDIDLCNPLDSFLFILNPIMWFVFLVSILFNFLRGGKD